MIINLKHRFKTYTVANSVAAPLIRTNKIDMEISERAAQLTPSLTLSIDSKAKAMKAEGIDVCGFGAGEPDFDTPEHIKAAAIEALQAGFTKYTPSAGIPELRAAIAEKFTADNGLTYRAGQVVVSNGAKHSCYNAILATCQPGDEVIIPAPYWVSYPDMVRLVGAEPVIVPTMERNNWKMSAEDFENAMTPRTKMLIMNSPCNPTGSVYTREELEAIVEVASGEDIYILSDEIYEKLIYDDAKHVSIASLSKEAYDLTITVNGFSKSYAMTGWRLGYLAAPEAVAKAVDSIQSHTTANPSAFSQRGALAALKGDQQCVADMREEFDMRRNYMIDRLSKIPNITAVKPQGAFYVLVNVSQLGLTSQNFADRLLSKSNVAVVPGAAFGDDRTIRLSYATSIDIIKKGLDRFQDFCRTL
jgi:aspartate aminotransferase